MISSIEIKNFKALNKLILPKLNKITLIGGRNNCGKTTLLEAIFLLFDRTDPNLFIRQSNWRGIMVIPNDIEFTWAPHFSSYDTNKEIHISALIGKRKMALAIRREKNYKVHIPSTVTMNQISPMTFDPKLQSIALNALHLKFTDEKDLLEESYLVQEPTGVGLNIKYSSQLKRSYTAYFGARVPSNQEEDSERLGRLEIENKTKIIIEILQSIVPEISSIKSIRIANTSIIYVGIEQEKMIPISYMGDGVARLLALTLGIASCKNSVILIDEIENGLHHSILSKVWKGISKASELFNCQVICTTHSLECVSAVNNALQNTDTDYGYIRLEKSDDSITGKHFDKEILSYAIESEMEIR